MHGAVGAELRRQQVHLRRADEPGHELVDRIGEQLLRRRALLQDATIEHRDPVAHRHRLHLVVGDVDRRHAEASLEGGDLGAGLHAQLGVEVRQRLVHQEHLRLAHDRPTHRHPLALPARQLGRLAIEVLLEVEDAGRLAHPPGPLFLRHPLHLEVEADVLGDRHVRVQGVGLEHHRDVAVLRRQRGDVAIADVDRPLVDRLEPGQHPQRRRLAASRRADEHEELAVGDGQVEVVDGGVLEPAVRARRAGERHLGHRRDM